MPLIFKKFQNNPIFLQVIFHLHYHITLTARTLHHHHSSTASNTAHQVTWNCQISVALPVSLHPAYGGGGCGTMDDCGGGRECSRWRLWGGGGGMSPVRGGWFLEFFLNNWGTFFRWNFFLSGNFLRYLG